MQYKPLICFHHIYLQKLSFAMTMDILCIRLLNHSFLDVVSIPSVLNNPQAMNDIILLGLLFQSQSCGNFYIHYCHFVDR